jgi:DNA-binding XRE family transcriptional regulator
MKNENSEQKANKKPELRFSFPPYWVGTMYKGIPILSYPGDHYEALERGFAPSADDVRRTLLTLRRELRWSRTTLSAVLGVSRDVVRRWEDGERNPSGAARRLIWLIDLYVRDPKQFKSALDLILWGKSKECMAVSRQLAKLGAKSKG